MASAVALDFDGLLYSDELEDFFWFEVVPKLVSRFWKLSEGEAKERVLKLYRLFPKDVYWIDPKAWSYLLGVPELDKAYLEHILPIRKLLVDKSLLNKLREKFLLGLWTNSPRWKVDAFCSRDRLEFDFIITADELKVLKPSLEFYKLALSRLNKSAEEVLLITHDEREKIAEKLGIKVFVVEPEGFANLVRQLLK